MSTTALRRSHIKQRLLVLSSNYDISWIFSLFFAHAGLVFDRTKTLVLFSIMFCLSELFDHHLNITLLFAPSFCSSGSAVYIDVLSRVRLFYNLSSSTPFSSLSLSFSKTLKHHWNSVAPFEISVDEATWTLSGSAVLSLQGIFQSHVFIL